jgi:hypothetical protein
MRILMSKVAGHPSALLFRQIVAGGLVLAWSAAANAADFEDGRLVNCPNTINCGLTIPAPPQGKVNKIDYVTCKIQTSGFLGDSILVQANNNVHGFFLRAPFVQAGGYVAEGPVRWLAGGSLLIEAVSPFNTDIQFACTVAGTVQ